MENESTPTTHTNEKIAREIEVFKKLYGGMRPKWFDGSSVNWVNIAADVDRLCYLLEQSVAALATATDEGLDKAIAAFNNEIARQAEFGMYPSEEDFRLALEAARKG